MAYPIRLLEEGQRDLHKYLRDLEQVVIDVLADFGVEAHRQPPNTGVWVGARKIASLGVAVRRWVTWTGWRSTSTHGPMPSPRSGRADWMPES
ncbi:MAG: hypothetical protein R3E96_08920 [Planctomycetota bacterium]